MPLDPTQHFAKMEYERQVAQASGGGATGIEAAGPPSWDRGAWESHKAQFGEYPFKATGPLPSTFEGAPDWVYQLMGLRRPPVDVRLGSSGSSASPSDRASVWGIK